MKISKVEQKILDYLFSTCMFGGGQNIYNIEECGLDDKYETKRVSQIMQSLKKKGLVDYVSCTRVWYLTREGKDFGQLRFRRSD